MEVKMTEDELKVKLFDSLLTAYHVSGDTIRAWGEDIQFDKTIEECAELIVALQHSKSRTLDIRNLATEIADVLVMVVCCARIIGEDVVSEEMHKKLQRLKGRLETVKPKLDMEEKYKKAVQHSTEMESLYYMELTKVEELREQLKKLQDILPKINATEEKVVDELLVTQRGKQAKRTLRKTKK
jgi:NTP pyrophosphatase (non-canonical NTP hydrolase)